MADRTEVILEEVRDMFRTLADGVAGNTEAIQELRDRVGRLEQRQDVVSGQIGALQAGQDELRADLNELRTEVNELRKEFNSFKVTTERILEDHEERLTVVEATSR